MKSLDDVGFSRNSFAAVFLWVIAIPCASAQLAIDSYDGPVTQNEIDSSRAFVQRLTPASSNMGNAWAQAGSGEQTRGMGLVYQATGDTGILDQEIRFCDAVLSERNDLAPAPVGQYVIWTGGIDPVWPNSTKAPIGTGGEQGYVAGHLANCARNILETPAIWNTPVPIGDPYGNGTTYLERAQTFVAGADTAIDGHILQSELDLSRQNHYYFAAADPYKGGKPVPWNQTMMFNYLFSNMAIAHEILGDDPARVSLYDGIVQANLDWFFTSGSTSYSDQAGNTAYNWAYSLPQLTGEDAEEGQWDVDGFYRLWVSGRYQFSVCQMRPFANTFVDVMTLGPNSYAGRVDGTSGSGHAAQTTSIHQGWLLLADLRPDAYYSMMSANLPTSGSTGNFNSYNRFLFVKSRRFLRGVGVDLCGAFNVEGIVSDGTNFSGGLDGGGYAYSTNLLGEKINFNNAAFSFGMPNTANVVSANGQIISLPSGPFSSLNMLATGVNGSQPAQTFLVIYSDGTTATFTQDMSDWSTAQGFPGESTATSMAYRDVSDGSTDSSTFNLYGYGFALDNSRTVSSITLPNNANVEILAITLSQ